jgi:hypothetical protein
MVKRYTSLFFSDINECVALDKPCGTYAFCENSSPGYNCVCPQGYTGKPNPNVACEQGFVGAPPRMKCKGMK